MAQYFASKNVFCLLVEKRGPGTLPSQLKDNNSLKTLFQKMGPATFIKILEYLRTRFLQHEPEILG